MSREITVNETNAALRNVYFDIRMIDGITPDLSQVGGQPEISINNGSWSSIGISTLSAIGFGKYYAILDPSLITTVGNTILPRYLGSTEAFAEEIVIVAIAGYFDTNALASYNSYVQISEANDYFNSQLNTGTWDNATPKDRLKSLIEATRLIDRLSFFGVKTGKLEFPRNFLTIVPNEIKIACCEIAIKLLDDIDLDLEISNLNITDPRFSSLSSKVNRDIPDEALRAGIPSKKAWLYLKPFLNDPLSIKITRV